MDSRRPLTRQFCGTCTPWAQLRPYSTALLCATHIPPAGKTRCARRASATTARAAVLNFDVLGVHRYVAACGEGLDDAVHHFAGAADSRCNVLLCQALRHHSPAVQIQRALINELGEAPVDVPQREVANLFDKAARLGDQQVDQVPREQRVALGNPSRALIGITKQRDSSKVIPERFSAPPSPG